MKIGIVIKQNDPALCFLGIATLETYLSHFTSVEFTVGFIDFKTTVTNHPIM